MVFRLITLTAVCVCMLGCAKLRSGRPWPAQISSITGFEDSERNQVIESLRSLNVVAGRTAVEVDSPVRGFSIAIEKRLPPEDKPYRAGLATFDDSHCTIEISPRVLTQYKDYLSSVLWHEIGHCGGLDHNDEKGELMYHTSDRFERYSTDSLTRFFTALFSRVPLE